MRFQIEVGMKDTKDVWWEDYDKEDVVDEATARAWAENTVQQFNDTITDKREPLRCFTGGVKILGKGSKEHRWTRLNWTTMSDHRGVFDMMRCERCGAEGRRYGLGERGIKRGAAWKAKKWKSCPGIAARPNKGNQ